MLVIYFLYIIFISTKKGFCYAGHQEDPSYQELEMFEWSSGIRVAYCVDAPLPDVISPFRRTMAKIATKYCQNVTACNMKSTTVFNAEQIVLMDGFPRREYGTIQIKFYIILPHNTDAAVKQQRPLIPRAVISDMLTKHLTEISNRLGWSIISYEKYPRYDSMTEFMNIAIIPIVVFSIPLMIFLAYWTSTLRPNMNSEAWMVTGSAGGKNAALRRTMEIIAEENAEIERRQRLDLTKNLVITGGNEGITSTGQLLLNVARLSMASSQPQSPTSCASPQIIISPSDTLSPSSSSGAVGSQHAQHLYVKPKHSRRQSSVDDIKQARRARGIHTSSGGQKRWKSGSLMLGAFSKPH
ncbi:unnamed protein product [Auanema sp. JU1783]|nr:unnamed protein product [Auanema sp. JU1783]